MPTSISDLQEKLSDEASWQYECFTCMCYEVGSIDTWHETEGCKAKKSWEEKREYIKICRFSCPRIVCEGGGKEFGGRKIGIQNSA